MGKLIWTFDQRSHLEWHNHTPSIWRILGGKAECWAHDLSPRTHIAPPPHSWIRNNPATALSPTLNIKQVAREMKSWEMETKNNESINIVSYSPRVAVKTKQWEIRREHFWQPGRQLNLDPPRTTRDHRGGTGGPVIVIASWPDHNIFTLTPLHQLYSNFLYFFLSFFPPAKSIKGLNSSDFVFFCVWD